MNIQGTQFEMKSPEILFNTYTRGFINQESIEFVGPERYVVGRVLAVQGTGLGSIPNIPYDLPSTSRNNS